jgi:hypothetical protein
MVIEHMNTVLGESSSETMWNKLMLHLKFFVGREVFGDIFKSSAKV